MLIPTLEKLVSYRTVSNNIDASRQLFAWINQSILSLPLFIEKFDSNGFPSLIITTKKTRRPKLWLAAHIDVVDGSDSLFSLKEDGDQLVGRGVFDMKYAAASYITLVHELNETLPSYDFGIMLTSDEELGGANGTKALLGSGFSGEACLLPDGGRNWTLITQSKGVLQTLLTAKGTSAHGSRPWEGINAADQLIAAYSKFRLGFHRKFPDPKIDSSLTLAKFSSGTAENQVPDCAEALLDIRTKDAEQTKIIRSLLPSNKNVHSSITKEAPGFSIDTKDPLAKRFEQCATETNISLTYGSTFGSCDARYFSAHGIPTIVIRPPGGGHHSEHEWISKKGLEQFYTLLKHFVASAAR